MIEAARQQVAIAANVGLSTLYWQLGRRVHTKILEGRRAEYGGQIVAVLGRQLAARHGRGFDEKSLRHMVRFAEAFSDAEIVSALRRHLSWTHFKQLIYIDDPLKRDFYAEMCRIEGWSTRMLAQKIEGMLYERTALSKKPDRLIRQELAALRDKGDLTPALVLQDPYMLDFLGLADTYSEKDLESAILREIERFLLELGAGFAFVERQTISSRRTQARWNCTSAGLIATIDSPPRRRRLASSSAQARSAKPSSISTWTHAESTWPST
jgi:predicted nuclease of restriction endonuclease-like (RecB) superfamily